MKITMKKPMSLAVSVLLGVTGCQQTSQHRPHSGAMTQITTQHRPLPASPPKPAQSSPPIGYGPTYTTVNDQGINWTKGSMAFPTGLRESSGLLVEKLVPTEALVGQPFYYEYHVSNLTDYPIQTVTLMDRVTGNFSPGDAEPQASDNRDGVATWQLGNLGPKESKVVKVKGSAKEEGAVSTCGWATYSPVVCEDIRIVKANISLVKVAPAEVTICDPIPMKLTVKNTGSSGLTGVKISDALPEGLTSEGKSSLTFDAGDLAPGATKDFTFNATAANPGKYVNVAKVTSAQGVGGDASSTTVVHQPVLTLSCKAPEERFMGRPFDVCFTVGNSGDAPSDGTTLVLPIPTGLTFKSATAGGAANGNTVSWDLGTVATDGPKEVCVTLVSSTAGNFSFQSTIKGACAKSVSTACQTRVVGVAAILLEKSDDPDPIQVGETTTYTVKITNQGTADDSNVGMVLKFPAEITPVTATGGSIDGQTVTFPAVPHLAPKDAVTYKVVAKGVKAGDAHVIFTLTSDALKSPINAEESTHVY